MKSLHKKISIALIICLFSFMSSGCWNRRELSELNIVGAASLDLQSSNGKMLMTFEVINPQSKEGSSGEAKPVFYLQSSGESVFDTIRNVTVKSDKKLFWPHANVYYFSTEVAQNGLMQYMDYFNRNHESRRYVNLAIVKDIPAYKIFELKFAEAENEIPSNYIEKLYANDTSNGKSVSVKLLDFLKTYYADGIEPVIGVIQIAKRIDTKEEKKSGQQSGGGQEGSGGSKDKSSSQDEENMMPSVEGLGVIKGDKLVGFFDGFETRGYNFVSGKIKSGIMVTPSEDGEGRNAVEIIKSRSKLAVKMQDGKITATVNIELNGMLNEATGKIDVANAPAIKLIEEKTSDRIKEESEQAIRRAKEYKSDIFGFGSLLHTKYPDEWKKVKQDWNDVFSNLEVEVKVNTSIQKIGVESDQIKVKEEQK